MKIISSTKHKIIATFLTLLIAVYVGNVNFFVHEHQVGDITIVHSHPYASSSHGHSLASITAISWLSHFSLVEMECNSIESPFFKLLCVVDYGKIKDCIIGCINYSLLRAPPCL